VAVIVLHVAVMDLFWGRYRLWPSSVLIVKRRDKFLARYKQFEVDHTCFLL